jgi:proteic killer suppression protein
MILSFGNKLAYDLVEENSSKEVKSFPKEIYRASRRKLQLIHEAWEIQDLKIPPGNRLEKLKGNLKDYFSIRINDQWRITFKFENHNAYEVAVVDYH